MKISKSILDYRKRNNLSQEQLASKIGVTRQAISKWEQEKGTPDIENLILLSEEMNISLDNLIKGNNGIKERIMNNEKSNKNSPFSYFVFSCYYNLYCLFYFNI
ncbi:helix-turn-helix transcriptional regulator [Bacillus cereus]